MASPLQTPGTLESTLVEVQSMLQEAQEGPRNDAGVLVRLSRSIAAQEEGGVGGWVLPLSDLAGTAVPGPIARSAHAPRGIMGITGVRGQVLTVIDAQENLKGHPIERPQDGWLALVSSHLGFGWGILWPELVGLRPRDGWIESPPSPEDPLWISRVWHDDNGVMWNELNLEVWLSQWIPQSDPLKKSAQTP